MERKSMLYTHRNYHFIPARSLRFISDRLRNRASRNVSVWHRFITERYALPLNCWGISIWQVTKSSHLAALLNLMCNSFAVHELRQFLFLPLYRNTPLMMCTSHSFQMSCSYEYLYLHIVFFNRKMIQMLCIQFVTSSFQCPFSVTVSSSRTE